MGKERITCSILRLVWSHLIPFNPFVYPQKWHKIASNFVNCVTVTNAFCSSRSNSTLGRKMLIRNFDLLSKVRALKGFRVISLYRQLLEGERHKLSMVFHRIRICCACDNKPNFVHRYKWKNKAWFVFLTAASVFKWERDGVTDEELARALSEMEAMRVLMQGDCGGNSRGQPQPPQEAGPSKRAACSPCEGCELCVDRPNLKVWRRFVEEHKLFEYRVYGSFTDITPRAFYDTQMDLKFWCGYEPHTIRVNVIDSDAKSNNEVVHWVYRYPYPMSPRDYCYVRRGLVDAEMNRMVIRARAVEHPQCVAGQQTVRVRQYNSQLVIMPNSSFDQNGFSFYLTYFDNPQSQIPSFCYNWLASSGVPDFVEQLHNAAKVMQERTKEGYTPNVFGSYHSTEHLKEN